ncbi:MAG: DciA family protein [Acetobacteraceae bacterium]
MAANAGEGKAPATVAPASPPRHLFGPRPLGAILPAVTRPAFRRRAPAAARLIAEWESIVGPELAAACSPRRFTAGTLTLDCAAPLALELLHRAPLLLERINCALGAPLVARLRFQQGAPAVPPARPLPAPRRQTPPRGDLPPGPVGEALAALARHIVAEG